MKSQNEGLQKQLLAMQKDLVESRKQTAEREVRLLEASSELSLAREVIDDIASSKLAGLRRFFEHYDLPSVCLSLFRKLPFAEMNIF